MIGCLRTRVRKQPIIALYFEPENENLEARIKMASSTTSAWTNYGDNNWAMSCDFQQCGILPSVDSDEPVQPTVKLRNSKCCLVSSLKFIEYSSD